MEQFLTPEFWVAVGQIVMIDILLGGDNAVVIALACRKLPANQRTRGILWGTAGAIVLRVVLIFFALTVRSCWYGLASSSWRPTRRTITAASSPATSCWPPSRRSSSPTW